MTIHDMHSALAIQISALLSHSPPNFESIDIDTMAVVHTLQALLILVIILILIGWSSTGRKNGSSIDNLSRVSRRTYIQFENAWITVWFTWLVLYVWYAIVTATGYADEEWARAGVDILNITTSIAIFNCYFILDKPSVALAGEDDRSRPYRHAMIVVIAVAIVVALISVLGTVHNFHGIGRSANGMFAGVAIVFFAGRLDSHLLRVPRPFLSMVYIYGLVQMFYVETYGSNHYREFYGLGLFTISLVCKLLLFGVIIMITREHDLARYLQETVALLEVRPHGSNQENEYESMNPTSALGTLLVELFSVDELRRIPVDANLQDGKSIAHNLPGPRASAQSVAYELADMIIRRGDASIFDYLSKERVNRMDIIEKAKHRITQSSMAFQAREPD